MQVFSEGSIWVTSQRNGIRYYECQGLDEHGAPRYPLKPQMWAMPEGFQGKGAKTSQSLYVPETDTLYVGGFTSQRLQTGHAWGSPMSEIVRYEGWLKGKPEVTCRYFLPYTPKSKGGHSSYVANGMSLAGNKLFVIMSASSLIHVYDRDSGKLIKTMFPGAEVAGIVGLIDIIHGVNALKRSNGEYIIFTEDDSRGKVLMFRWDGKKGALDVH